MQGIICANLGGVALHIYDREGVEIESHSLSFGPQDIVSYRGGYVVVEGVVGNLHWIDHEWGLYMTWALGFNAVGVGVKDACIILGDRTSNMLHWFDTEGVEIRGMNISYRPYGITSGCRGIAVSDYIGSKLYWYDDEGVEIDRWNLGYQPTGVSISKGEVVVVDYLNNRLRYYDMEGVEVRSQVLPYTVFSIDYIRR